MLKYYNFSANKKITRDIGEYTVVYAVYLLYIKKNRIPSTVTERKLYSLCCLFFVVVVLDYTTTDHQTLWGSTICLTRCCLVEDQRLKIALNIDANFQKRKGKKLKILQLLSNIFKIFCCTCDTYSRAKWLEQWVEVWAVWVRNQCSSFTWYFWFIVLLHKIPLYL